MKGITFNLLEEVVSSGHGETVWDEILDRANLEGAAPVRAAREAAPGRAVSGPFSIGTRVPTIS
ncbi:MAG: hypothetical protein ACREDL_14570 [Bradyrhizobium sp.]